MSSIDERIVEMQFDNDQFEHGIKTTIRSLEELKKGLDIDESVKSLNGLERIINTFSLSNISNNVEELSNRFSSLGIVGVTVLQRITNQAITTGERLVSALSLDPVKDGLAEYETQMGAIQTILANTKNKGSTMADVTAALDELNTYADKTIYNFTEMTRNIGTFTAAGIGLQASTQAIKGIANLAAVSGSNSTQASTAMYQLSQALAAGTVKLQDWNSVVNAGMGGEVFQEALKRTARNMGIAVDDIIKKTGSFRESLSKGWLTSDVLTETLAQIAGAYSEADLLAKGYTKEQTAEIMDLAQTAEDAATKVKTFTQLIDTIKEALGSGWTKSWEYIFGNFEEAEDMFTKISTTMSAFVELSSSTRNELLQTWNSLGGRMDVIAGLSNLFWDLLAVLLPVKRAFNEIFPPATAEGLVNLSKGFREMSKHLMITNAQADAIANTFKGVFSVIKAGLMIIKALAKALSPVGKDLLIIGNVALYTVGYIGELVAEFVNFVAEAGYVDKALVLIQNGLIMGVSLIIQFISSIIALISETAKLPVVQNTFSKIIQTIELLYNIAFDKVQSIISIFQSMTSIFEKTNTGTINEAFIQIGESASILGKFLTFVSFIVSSFFDRIAKGIEIIKNAPNKIVGVANAVKTLASNIHSFFKNLSLNGIFDSAEKVLTNFKDSIVEFVDTTNFKLSELDPKAILVFAFGITLTKLVMDLSKLAKTATGLMDTITDEFKAFPNLIKTLDKTLSKFGNTFKNSTVFQIATSITMLAGALVVLSQIPADKLLHAGLAMTGITVAIGAIMGLQMLMSRTGQTRLMLRYSQSLISMAGSVLILSAAFNSLDGVKLDTELGTKLLTIAVIMAEIVISAIALGKFVPTLSKGSVFLLAFSFSISNVINALTKISNVDTEQIADNIEIVSRIVGMMAILAWSAGKMTFGSGTGMLAMIASVVIFEKALKTVIDTGVDCDAVMNNIEKITVVLVTLVGFALLSQLAGKNALKAGVGLAAMTVSILLMSQVIKQLDKVQMSDPNKILKMLAGISALFAAFAVMSSDNQYGKMGANAIKLGAGLVLMSVAIAAIGKVVEMLGKVDQETLRRGLEITGGIGIIVATLVGVTALTKDAKLGPILAMIGAIGAIIFGLAMLTLLDPNKLLSAAVSLAAVLVGLGGAFYGLGNMNPESVKKTILTVVEAIILIGGATAAIITISQIPWTNVLSAALSLSGVIIAVATAGKIANNGTIQGAASILIIATSLMLAAQSLSALQNIDWTRLVAGGVALSAIMIAAAGAANLANGALPGAAAMVAMSASIIILTSAFQTLSEINLDGLIPALTSLGIALLVIVGVAATSAVFPPLAAGLVAVSGALLAISAASVLFGVGATLIASAVQSMVSSLQELGNMSPETAANIQNVIQTVSIAVGQGLGSIIIEFGRTLLSGIAEGITNLISYISGIGSTMIQIGSNLIHNLVNGVLGGVSNVTNTGKTVSISFISGIGNLGTQAFTAGINAVLGMIQGIGSGISTIFNAGAELGNSLLTGIKDALDIHSPSGKTEEAGEYAGEGLVKGSDETNASAVEAGARKGNAYLSGLFGAIQNGFSKIKGFVSGKVDETVDAISGAGENISDKASGFFDKIKGDSDFGLSDVTKDIQDLVSNMMKGTDTTSGLSGALDGLGNSYSGTSDKAKKSGKASKDDSKDKETEAKYIKYVTAAAQAYTEIYDEMNESLGNPTGFVSAKAAIERFAEAMYDAERATNGLDGVTEKSSERISNFRKQFIELYESVAKSITGLDKFSEISRSFSGTSAKSYVKNLKANSKAIDEWSKSLSVLVQKGYSKDVIKEIINDGVSDTSAFNDFLSASSEEVEVINNGYTEIQNKAASTANAAISALTAAAEQTAARIKLQQTESNGAKETATTIILANDQTVESTDNAVKKIEAQTVFVQQLYDDMKQALENTIKSQISMFDKFNKDTDNTKEEILYNMATQVNGIIEWGKMIDELAGKQIDDGLLQSLIEMGQESYGIVKEFNRMSDQELTEANSRYQMMQNLPEQTAEKITNSLNTLRKSFNTEVLNILPNNTELTETATEIAESAGEGFSQGFANGITNQNANQQASDLGNAALNSLQTSLDEHSPSKITTDMGYNFSVGLANGITSGEDVVLNAVESLATKMLNTVRSVLGIASPSKEMINVGMWTDLGFANGLLKFAGLIKMQAEHIGNVAIDAVNSAMISLEGIDLNFDVNPVITPVVDMTNINSSAAMINRSLGKSYGFNLSGIDTATITRNTGHLFSKDYDKVQSTYDDTQVIRTINDLGERVDILGKTIKGLKVVMDSGATVGALEEDIDRRLNARANRTRRGN